MQVSWLYLLPGCEGAPLLIMRGLLRLTGWPATADKRKFYLPCAMYAVGCPKFVSRFITAQIVLSMFIADLHIGASQFEVASELNYS